MDKTKKNKFLLIIPARAGSKGIKHKNLTMVGNKRLIDFTINTAKDLCFNGEKIISTDIVELINQKEHLYPIQVPFIRPKRLSSDNATAFDVVLHAINWFNKKDKNFDHIILLQPTNPFREQDNIQDAIDFFVEKKLKSLVAVTEAWQHPAEIIIKRNKKYIKAINEQEGRRQDFSKAFFISGALYIISVKELLKTKLFLNKSTYFYTLNPETGLDIDNEFQLKLANSYFWQYLN